VPPGVHVIAKIYPSLWRGRYPAEGRTPDQQDAYTACRWLQEADQCRTLGSHLAPVLTPAVAATARFEGWILGVVPTEAKVPAGPALPRARRPAERLLYRIEASR
jgi:hypothetical protein